jgi:probable addiction module antidote protein
MAQIFNERHFVTLSRPTLDRNPFVIYKLHKRNRFQQLFNTIAGVIASEAKQSTCIERSIFQERQRHASRWIASSLRFSAHDGQFINENTSFYPADFIGTPESQTELLADAVESGDAKYIAAALGTIARARGMTTVAQDSGVTREALYRALSTEGDPRLSTLLGVAKALGLKIHFSPAA